jgi:pimeloyl-ACP methyl ester carboxylesterase
MSIADTPVSHRLRRRLSIAVLGAALLIAAACGTSDSTTGATGPASTAPTTTVPSTRRDPPSSVSPTTPPTTAALPVPDATTSTGSRPIALLDELVGIEGGRVHVRCAGSGAVTVVLISGFEAGSAAWAAVEPAISARTRVCSYDRPGTGTSDPATSIATFSTQAHDLHDLLTTVGEPGPYVVVGHSFGGAEAVSFAFAFSGEVTGLVLVDASPVTWPAALCGVVDDGSDGATIVRDLCSRLSEPTSNAEHLDVFAAFADAAAITSLGSLPTAVITAVDRQLPAGLATDEVERLTDVWDQGQQRWSRLSTHSYLVPVENSSHDIQIDHPDVVTDQIVRLLP